MPPSIIVDVKACNGAATDLHTLGYVRLPGKELEHLPWGLPNHYM